MKNNLILVEGIPGSGKTTISGKIKEYLENKGLKVKLFKEGEAHPADMAWTAYVSKADYEKLLACNKEYAEAIEANTKMEEDYALVSYTKLGLTSNQRELMRYFEKHEVYDGKIKFDIFEKLHFERWKQFAESADENTIYIFECAYLQNHVNELMGFHNKDVKFILDYMVKLISAVKTLNPKLIYLTQSDIRKTIERVAMERISFDEDSWEDWIHFVIKYVENSPYGQKSELKGFNGLIKFFEARKKVEFEIIKKLDIDKAIIDNPNYDWEEVFNKVVREI